MKNLILLLTTAMSLITFAQNGKTDVENESLKGKVKSIKHISYIINTSPNETEEEKYLSDDNYIYLFNNQGYITKKIYIDVDNYTHFYHTFDYNKDNTIAEIREYNTQDELLKRTIPKYNTQKQKVKENDYEPSGKLSIKSTFSYQKNGLLAKETSQFSKGDKIHKISFTYNHLGKVSTKKLTEYYYNYISTTHYLYDDKANLIKSTTNYVDFNNKYMNAYYYNYDNAGNIIQQGNIDEHNKEIDIIYYQYEYDKHKNWIKRTAIQDNKTISITEREISYYE